MRAKIGKKAKKVIGSAIGGNITNKFGSPKMGVLEQCCIFSGPGPDPMKQIQYTKLNNASIFLTVNYLNLEPNS